MTSARLWLEERRLEMPEPLRPWVRVPGEDGDVVETLASAALASLEEALARPGRERPAAFLLLAADALLTYACEAAAEGPDARARLAGILARVSRWSR